MLFFGRRRPSDRLATSFRWLEQKPFPTAREHSYAARYDARRYVLTLHKDSVFAWETVSDDRRFTDFSWKPRWRLTRRTAIPPRGCSFGTSTTRTSTLSSSPTGATSGWTSSSTTTRCRSSSGHERPNPIPSTPPRPVSFASSPTARGSLSPSTTSGWPRSRTRCSPRGASGSPRRTSPAPGAASSASAASSWTRAPSRSRGSTRAGGTTRPCPRRHG